MKFYSTSQLEPAMGNAQLGGQPATPQRGWPDFEKAKDVVERELADGPACSVTGSPPPM